MVNPISLLVLTTPLAAAGVWWLVSHKIKPYNHKRKGHVLIKKLTPGGEVKKHYASPEKEAQDDKGVVRSFDWGGGKHTIYDAPGNFTYEGDVGIKTFWLDSGGNQVDFSRMQRIEPVMGDQTLESIATRVWNAGRAQALSDERNMNLTLIVSGATLVATVILVGLVFNLQDKVVTAIG